jgi:hypothetical protein
MNLVFGQTWRGGRVLPGMHRHTIAYILRLVKLPGRYMPERYGAVQNLDKTGHYALYFPITIVEDFLETD